MGHSERFFQFDRGSEHVNMLRILLPLICGKLTFQCATVCEKSFKSSRVNFKDKFIINM